MKLKFKLPTVDAKVRTPIFNFPSYAVSSTTRLWFLS